MDISAAMVKELRERTGAGMMECKKALVQTQGDLEEAVEILRKKSKDIADKKSSRVAAEGIIAMVTDANNGVMVEVNCETDFVAKKSEFNDFAQALAQHALRNQVVDAAALLQVEKDGKTFEEQRLELVALIGENISVRRAAVLRADHTLGYYQHGQRIGVMVDLKGGDNDLAKDICMHIAASNPICIDESQIPQSLLDKEKEIYMAQAQESGKPPEIAEKMVTGRLQKYIGQVTLLGQPFVKDPDQTVAKILKAANAQVMHFERFGVGEGIEKKSENFAEEVMAQVKGK